MAIWNLWKFFIFGCVFGSMNVTPLFAIYALKFRWLLYDSIAFTRFLSLSFLFLQCSLLKIARSFKQYLVQIFSFENQQIVALQLKWNYLFLFSLLERIQNVASHNITDWNVISVNELRVKSWGHVEISKIPEKWNARENIKPVDPVPVASFDIVETSHFVPLATTMVHKVLANIANIVRSSIEKWTGNRNWLKLFEG